MNTQYFGSITPNSGFNRSLRSKGLSLLMAGLVSLGVLSACTSTRESVGVMDSPEHHALRGNNLIDENRWAEALGAFNQGLSLNPKSVENLSGKAVVLAHDASVSTNSKNREKLASEARDLAESAKSKAEGKDQERLAHQTLMRVYGYIQTPENWLKRVEDHFQEALEAAPPQGDPTTHLYMARAYRAAFALDKAQAQYTKVLSMNGAKTAEADRELEMVQKVMRAQPGSRVGKQVAFMESLTRGDLAALFVEELNLGALYSRNAQQDNSFRAPGQKDPSDRKATDLDNHPLASDIQEVLRLGVNGLTLDGSGKYYPNEKITRAEFAVMVEDVLVRVTGETKLKTKFIGSESAFPDVRADAPYFNAVQTVVSRKLMEVKNSVRGQFAPGESMAGVDALLVIRALKNELKSYLR